MIQRFGEKNRVRKEMIRQMDEQTRMEKIVADRQLSSDERELNRFEHEEREEMIKEKLEFMRERRRDDIAFGHQPLDTPNVTNNTEWEVLKEPNLFSKKSNMLSNEHSIMKNDPNLLKDNGDLFKNNPKLLKGGNIFKI